MHPRSESCYAHAASGLHSSLSLMIAMSLGLDCGAGATQDTDEIGFQAGAVIRVLEKKGDWWKGSVNGTTGL